MLPTTAVSAPTATAPMILLDDPPAPALPAAGLDLALRLALDYLESCRGGPDDCPEVADAIEALHDALAALKRRRAAGPEFLIEFDLKPGLRAPEAADAALAAVPGAAAAAREG